VRGGNGCHVKQSGCGAFYRSKRWGGVRFGEKWSLGGVYVSLR
jgi:hypothetical protein